MEFTKEPGGELMSLHERLERLVKCIELEEKGKMEEADLLRQTVPIRPFLAKFAKKYFGTEYLKQSKWNLTQAEVEYGADWLDRRDN